MTEQRSEYIKSLEQDIDQKERELAELYSLLYYHLDEEEQDEENN